MHSHSSLRPLSWASLLTLSLLVGACGKKDADVPASAAMVQGSWRFSAYTITPAYDLTGTGTKTNDMLQRMALTEGQVQVDCFKSTTITFGADKKVTASAPSTCGSAADYVISNKATWSITGNKLETIDGTDVAEFDASVSGNTLKLSYSDTDDYDNDGNDETVTLTFTLTKV